MKTSLSVIFFLSLYLYSYSQQKDTSHYQLPEVEVKALTGRETLRLLNTQSSFDNTFLNLFQPVSPVSALNNFAGVRMEERSPGSYRLSIRGSLLRSPFGIRNVKIYLGDLPFTDAGGNAYLNALDFNYINSLKLLKGPAGSLYGANTGGVVLIDPVLKTADTLAFKFQFSSGSFGLLKTSGFFQKKWKRNMFTVNYGWQKSSGYRENSSLQRHYIQLAHTTQYTKTSSLKLLLLLSHLNYETPGGLTYEQTLRDPSKARLPTRTLKGASEQRAGVRSATAFGGLTHEINITPGVRHVISFFGSYTDFNNPFITNYETRKELTAGVRTYAEIKLLDYDRLKIRTTIGAEWQNTLYHISNYGNNYGSIDTLQVRDRIRARQSFLFGRLLADISDRLLLEFSVSSNHNHYYFRNLYPFYSTQSDKKAFPPVWLPKLSASYLVTDNFSLRASVSKGFSPPTVAEVRSSDNVINTSLRPEFGYNYETGLRFSDNREIISTDLTAFLFGLQDAIVRRTNETGTESFTNAGGTSQKGLEAELTIRIFDRKTAKLFKSLKTGGSLTVYDFVFTDYKAAGTDYSKNKLTGVPSNTTSQYLSAEIASFQLSIQHYAASGIPLNDAGAVYAEPYSIWQLRGSFRVNLRRAELTLFAGSENLTDEKYSLGHDLNAAGGRFYNPAPPRSYYGGAGLTF